MTRATPGCLLALWAAAGCLVPCAAGAQSWFEVYNAPQSPITMMPATVAPEDAVAIDWFQKVRDDMGIQPLGFIACYLIASEYRFNVLTCKAGDPPPEACGWQVRAVELNICHSGTLLTSPDRARHYFIDSLGTLARMRPERPGQTWLPFDQVEEMKRLYVLKAACSNPLAARLSGDPAQYWKDVADMRFRLEISPYSADDTVGWWCSGACPGGSGPPPSFTPPAAGDGACQNPVGGHLPVQPIASFDPNAMVGPPGHGDERFLARDAPLHYAVLFENLETATAPAQAVAVTVQLDPANVDLDSLSLGPVSIGSAQAVPPPGLRTYADQLDLRPRTPLLVRVEASLDPGTGLLSWRLTSIDPATGSPPDDPRLGFLPPATTPPDGDGSVLFSVTPLPGLATGKTVGAQARIVFDANAPLDTQEWVNTIDGTKPTSTVVAASVRQNATATFDVRWAGSDVGSGLRDYTVYVSEDGGPFAVWLRDTVATSAEFKGQAGKRYAFASTARDEVGNVEDAHGGPDVTTPAGTQTKTGQCGCSSPWEGGLSLAGLALAAIISRRTRRPRRGSC